MAVDQRRLQCFGCGDRLWHRSVTPRVCRPAGTGLRLRGPGRCAAGCLRPRHPHRRHHRGQRRQCAGRCRSVVVHTHPAAAGVGRQRAGTGQRCRVGCRAGFNARQRCNQPQPGVVRAFQHAVQCDRAGAKQRRAGGWRHRQRHAARPAAGAGALPGRLLRGAGRGFDYPLGKLGELQQRRVTGRCGSARRREQRSDPQHQSGRRLCLPLRHLYGYGPGVGRRGAVARLCAATQQQRGQGCLAQHGGQGRVVRVRQWAQRSSGIWPRQRQRCAALDSLATPDDRSHRANLAGAGSGQRSLHQRRVVQ